MLNLDNLSYHPAITAEPILRNVNLELAPQQLGLVIGPSGSGKSTLLEILAGFAGPTSGSVRWRKQTLTSADLQQLGGLVFQFPERFFCGSTVLHELRLGHPELDKGKVKQVLASVGLGHLSLQTAPQNLSGGQQRRLSLAVQLIRQPYLLLLDEPTAGLDWSMRRQLIQLLAELKQQLSLLVVTHDAADLLAVADRAWTLDQGILTPADLEQLRHGLRPVA